MALIVTTKPVKAGALAAYTASNPAGDKGSWSGGDVIVEFRNGHASSITVTIPKVQATAVAPGVGSIAVPDIVAAVVNAQDWAIRLKKEEISAYLDTNGQFSINYTSGNALLLVRVMEL